MPALAVMAATEGDLPASQVLARELGVPWLPAAGSPLDHAGEYAALLVVCGARLALQPLAPTPARGRKGRASLPGPVAVDFGSPAMRHRRQAGQNELLGCEYSPIGEGQRIGSYPRLSSPEEA